ncbi:cytochrome P450 [Dactylosporangium fulvum]|uniref:Cytochrome P450 n=1 Tax=Dactylosporangium fulvum TaxID=53359 RepID=A0ABY5W8N4_9ACTN|nr:cytochrome P450 [Dactylosporangium fulvum]UWP84431.1 cytochrome P450 [Dactylosporangium fulvum]
MTTVHTTTVPGCRADRARQHELRLLAASRPGFPALLTLGRFARPMRRVPGLGWVVADPGAMRRILADRDHFTIVGEGVVGHLWARVLGGWVYDLFDGPGHQALRATTRDLFTEERAAVLVARAAGPRLRRCTAELAAGATVDVAELSREVVGRVVADLLGLPGTGPDATYREIFDTGLALAALAARSTASPHVPPRIVDAGKAIVARMTAQVAAGWRTAPGGTLLGRCRELGLGLRETEGLAALLTVAGTQTTASAMARTVALLHDTGEQDRLRAEPHLLPAAVREGLRVACPIPVITRSVTTDVEVAGRRLRAGHRVLLLTATANHARGGFDLDNPHFPELRHLWFGAGRHFCLGAPVGRAEVSALLDALLATGRPWHIRQRRYGHRVLIPAYASLRIVLRSGGTH